MTSKKCSSAKKSDGQILKSLTELPTNQKTDRKIHLLNRKKPKIDKTIDTDFTTNLKLNKEFKFSNNFTPLPIITTDTVIMIPKKTSDKGKGKEPTSPTEHVPLPVKIPTALTAPTAPQNDSDKGKDTPILDVHSEYNSNIMEKTDEKSKNNK